MLFFDQFSKEGIGSLSHHKSEQQCFYRRFFLFMNQWIQTYFEIAVTCNGFPFETEWSQLTSGSPGFTVVVVIHRFSVIQAGRVVSVYRFTIGPSAYVHVNFCTMPPEQK